MTAQTEPKRLYRSSSDIKWAGVCGGLADYLATDATVIRLAWVVLTILTGIVPGIIAYIIAALVMPVEPATGNGGNG